MDYPEEVNEGTPLWERRAEFVTEGSRNFVGNLEELSIRDYELRDK